MSKKYILLLGSSGDIGKSIARRLAFSGWSIYLHYNNQEKETLNLRNELSEKYTDQDFFSIKADLSNDNINLITDSIFSLDGIVFAQGLSDYGLFTSLSDIKFAELIAVNYEIPLKLIQKLQDKISRNNFGRIVFIGSVYQKVGSAMESMYSSLKGAISSFVNAYAKEVASLGISVNAVAPGAVKTNMLKDFSNEEIKNLIEEIPVGRLASPADISFWVDVLLKEESSYMTGQTIYVDGGWLV